VWLSSCQHRISGIDIAPGQPARARRQDESHTLLIPRQQALAPPPTADMLAAWQKIFRASRSKSR